MENKTTQIYHPWDKWEDHKHGFYDNISGRDKKEMINKETAFNEYESELKKQRDAGQIMPSVYRQILENLDGEKNRTFINKVKSIGLKRFFDKLIETNQKLII